MLERIKYLPIRIIVNDNQVPTRLFTTSLYIFLLIKILFIIPLIDDIVSYYRYHSVSTLKQLIVAPGIIAVRFPTTFLIAAITVITILIFIKRNYYLNALGFWISLNVTQLCEPVSNGSDYVLNLMLLLSIPLSDSSVIPKWKNFQPIIFNFSVLLIQAHIALIYFLSAFDKLTTKSWRSGEAISFITSLDYYVTPLVAGIHSMTLNIIIAWCVIVFELAFPLLIWFKTFRLPLLIVGILFHIGIIFFLNLPDFGLLMIVCYTIFLKRKLAISLRSLCSLFKY